MRKPRVNTFEYAQANPNRLHIWKWGTWDVWRGIHLLKECTTHAEAIAYANRKARK